MTRIGIKLFLVIIFLNGCGANRPEEVSNEDVVNTESEPKLKELILKHNPDTLWREQLSYFDAFSFEMEEYFKSQDRPILIDGYVNDIEVYSDRLLIYIWNYHYGLFILEASDSLVNRVFKEKYRNNGNAVYAIAKVSMVRRFGFRAYSQYGAVNDDFDLEIEPSFYKLLRGVCIDLIKK